MKMSYKSRHGSRTGKRKSKSDGRPSMSYFTGKGKGKKSKMSYGGKMKGSHGGDY